MASAPVELTVDVNTRTLGEQEDFFVVRPGSDYSLYNDFQKLGAVFLDFPDIGLPRAGRPTKEWLREAVVRSMAIRDWHRDKRRYPEPSRDQVQYSGQAYGRKIGRYVGAIERLYYELPEGTIVIVPGPGPYSNVLVGELQGKGTPVGRVDLYPGESLPGRQVKWRGQKQRGFFSPELRDRLGSTTPVMLLDRSLRAEVLSASYDQYIIGETVTTRIKTTREDFSTLNDYDLQSFINYTSGVIAASEDAREGSVTLAQALAALRRRREDVLELTSNINSPGALRLLSTKLTPLAVGVLLAVALSSGAPALPDNIHVINSAAATAADPCALHVQQQVMSAIKLMDLDTWHQVCVQARDAAEVTGLSTSIDVVPPGQGT